MAEQTVSHGGASLPLRQWIGERGLLALLLIVFAALSVWNNIALPVFEAPDEGDHFAYADFLADERRLPDLERDLYLSHEFFQPPLYYALAALVIAPIDRSNLNEINKLNPDWFDRDVNADFRSVANQYIHTPAERFPYYGAALALHVARLLSTVLGACVILLVYGIARMLSAGGSSAQHLPLFAAALVALNPKFIHISSMVGNDIAIILMATLACAWMLRMWYMVNTPSARVWLSYLVLGALVGLALLSKISGLGLLAPAMLLLVFMYLRVRSTRQALAWLAAFILGFALIAGPWLLFNVLRYGDPLAWAQTQAANASLMRDPPLNLAQMAQTIPQVLISYWGVIGIEVRFPDWVDALFGIGLAAAVLGCVLALARKLLQARALGLAAFVPTLLLLTWQLALISLYSQWLRTVTATENSRLLFPGIAAVTIAVAAGWLHLTPVRLRGAAMGAVVAGLLALSIATPLHIIPQVFTEPTILTVEERAALPGQTGVTFGGKLRLQHAQLNARDAAAGSRVPVTLYWGAEQRMAQSYRAVLSAHDAQGQLIARLEAIPFNGRFDTQRWQPGQFFRDDYWLPIDASARRGIATISLAVRGIYETPPLLPVDGAGTTEFLIGRVKVLGALDSAPAPQHVVTVFFAEGGDRLMELQGYDAQASAVVLHWLSHKQTNLDYTLFVHVLDGDGNIIAQEDAQPLAGAYPTSMWDAKEQIMDRRNIALPASAVRLRIGWYLPADGQRLQALQPDGVAWQDDVVIIELPPAGER